MFGRYVDLFCKRFVQFGQKIFLVKSLKTGENNNALKMEVYVSQNICDVLTELHTNAIK